MVRYILWVEIFLGKFRMYLKGFMLWFFGMFFFWRINFVIGSWVWKFMWYFLRFIMGSCLICLIRRLSCVCWRMVSNRCKWWGCRSIWLILLMMLLRWLIWVVFVEFLGRYLLILIFFVFMCVFKLFFELKGECMVSFFW